MKKNLLLLGLLFMILCKSYGQDTIYTYAWTPYMGYFYDLNDRDTIDKYFFIDTTQTNNIWQLGTPSKPIFNSAYSAPLALVTDTLNNYPNNNTSSFSFIVWTNCNWSEINFWHRINADSLKDGGVIEYSIDGGTTWNNILNSTYSFSSNFYSINDTIESNSNKSGFTGTSGWTYEWFFGPTLNNFIEYRFTFTSDSTNTNKEGWMIDDIVVNGVMVGINEIEEASSVQIFPNPTSDFILIKTNIITSFKSATIKDIFGKTIFVTNQTTIDLSKFETGIYLIEITTEDKTYVKRIIRK